MAQERPEQIREDIARRRVRIGQTIEQTADAIRYKADVPSRAKEKAKEKLDDAVSKVSNAVPGLPNRPSLPSLPSRPSGSAVTGTVRRAEDRAEGLVRDNPMGLAIGAAAIGFLAGLVLPSSRFEDDLLGPYADTVKDEAREAGQEALERGKSVAVQAAESAKEVAASAGRRQARALTSSTKGRARSVAS